MGLASGKPTAAAAQRGIKRAGPSPDRSFWDDATAARLLVLNNVLDTCLRGIYFAGIHCNLTPSEKDVLILVARQKLKLIDFVGHLNSENIARALHLRQRAVQLALARLEDLGVLIHEREGGKTSKLWISGDYFKPRRPRRMEPLSYPQKSSTGAKICAPHMYVSVKSCIYPPTPLDPPTNEQGVAPANDAGALSQRPVNDPATAPRSARSGRSDALDSKADRIPDEVWFEKNAGLVSRILGGGRHG